MHLFPPCSDVHTCLFLPLVPPDATSSGLAECRSQLSQTVIREQTALPLSATAVIPANEILLEAIGDILLQSASGGIIVKGNIIFFSPLWLILEVVIVLQECYYAQRTAWCLSNIHYRTLMKAWAQALISVLCSAFQSPSSLPCKYTESTKVVTSALFN